MLKLKTVRNRLFQLKKYQKPMEVWLFPIILLLYPLFGVSQGIDISDTTYSLGNYIYSDALDPMWFLATFIPNVLGKFLTFLPGKGSMLAMNFYCTFIISITALVAYYMLQRWIPGWMTFLGEMIAESLCWCPRVILYNYLTYLFFTLGVLLMLHAMTDYEIKRWKFVLAGACLGLNVMVRFPNVLECALILSLLYYEIIHKRDLQEISRKFFDCVLGYILGAAIPLLFICVLYRFSSYMGMISSLFEVSRNASDYSSGGMIMSVLFAWIRSFSNMIIMIPCMFASAILLLMYRGRFYWIKRIVYIGGLFVLMYYYYNRGVITRTYSYYNSMFEISQMFLIFGMVFLLIGLTPYIHGQASERSLCLAALLIIIITPLGSNNYTYPVINNLFIVAPVILWMFRRVRQAAGNNELHFTWKAMFMMILTVLCFQGGMFHLNYSFVDGVDGTKRDVLIGSSEIPRAGGMHTTPANADSVCSVYDYLDDNDLTDKKLLQFGKAPGFSYLFDMEPAIFTTWPDLDSNSTEKFSEALENVEESDLPVIIINFDFEGEVHAGEKYEILLDFMDRFGYNEVFENGRFGIMVPDAM
ncbi:hypothetical protein [Butyrivibrio sp. NC2002]|uniref:hypothetical protein n=1 Tax=Butyrivibrio sp. NC2002 TaxID=1410610 RepID=UPI00056518CF|nr:hypothetical protein [Butyrivibrio sp. NC2002]